MLKKLLMINEAIVWKKYSFLIINSAWKKTKIPHPIYPIRSPVKI